MQFNAVLSGAVASASFIVALFFLRFWKTSGDRFFLYFAASFALEAMNRMALGTMTVSNEDEPAYYVVRLVAFVLILIAIVDKNRRKRPPGHELTQNKEWGKD